MKCPECNLPMIEEHTSYIVAKGVCKFCYYHSQIEPQDMSWRDWAMLNQIHNDIVDLDACLGNFKSFKSFKSYKDFKRRGGVG